jgi:hypothetical protein
VTRVSPIYFLDRLQPVVARVAIMRPDSSAGTVAALNREIKHRTQAAADRRSPAEGPATPTCQQVRPEPGAQFEKPLSSAPLMDTFAGRKESKT